MDGAMPIVPHAFPVTLAVLLLWNVCTAFSASASDEQLEERYLFWQSKAFQCAVDGIHFPSRPTVDAGQPCDDGDMTLFNGLLCFAGEERGCEGVRQAQDSTTGEWFRSPRISLKGNDRGGASFSPDMALGVQLYLVKTRDVERATKWANWLHRLTPCSIESWWGDGCWVEGIPRFCAPEMGCTMRPGDAASLAQTFDLLHDQNGMEALPHGRLRGYLASFEEIGEFITSLNSRFNEPGFSQHLVAVEIMLKQASHGESAELKEMAKRLADKSENSGNAFLSNLAGKRREDIVQQVLDRCPSPAALPEPPLHQWQWERDTLDKAWLHSCYWDCIFMGRLLGV